MTDLAIQCAGLSKRYRIGQQERYKALRDVLTDAATAPFRRLRSALDRRPTTGDSSSNGHRSSVIRQGSADALFWALDDVSFEVKRGEVVGIIGRNGAGKSTLLKILSRITKPTRGHAEIHGRVGSLLEVGTGFHPELTGRENIYLNAAILGMRKAEVDRNLDEIVAFAEVEQFIDTPVKRYSSGMYVRLAFAVAAHMETEVLLVDEVLAVGDAGFQKKCLGKMGDVAKQGRTVLLVSHNLPMIQRLCAEGILLDGGKLVSAGPSTTCVQEYARIIDEQGESHSTRSSDQSIAISGVRVLDSYGRRTEHWEYGQPLNIEIDVEATQELGHMAIDLGFYATGGGKLFGLQSDLLTARKTFSAGSHKVIFRLENPGLSVPEIYLDIGLRTSELGFGYDILLTRAAVLSTKTNTLPLYSLADNLVTPMVKVSWI
jgi:lipopolysaccharide transport system ATP-binding protein